jgi:N-methylhydantoinase B
LNHVNEQVHSGAMRMAVVADANPGEIDQITTEVITHRLAAASEEMMATLVNTAYSPNIKERRDCSVAIFDSTGNLVALSAIAPIHLSSLLGLVQNVRQRFGLQARPGDAFLTNDPYVGGGSHLPDLTLVSPVFVEGRLVAFVANLAHHSDIGGKVAGSESADCTSIFQEGLRLPVVRLMDRGNLCRDILELVLLNSRTPREREGDLHAQIATNALGIRRMEEIFKRFGVATAEAGIRALLDYAEVRARTEIAKVPDGVYANEDYLDSDGVRDARVRLKVAVTVRGDTIHFDFAGTDPQVEGARNMPLVATQSAVYYAVKAITDPTLPPNAGYFRAIEIDVPEGSVLNCRPPAAVGDRSATGNIVGDLLLGALAQAVPRRVMAGCGPLHGLIFSGTDPRRNAYFVDYETYAGASGGLYNQDGRDAVRVHVSGAANLPIESVEQEFPLSVLCYELVADSGGPGRSRGGLATRRDVAVWSRKARLAGRGLRQVQGAPPLFGGSRGRTGQFVLNPGKKNEEKLPGAFSELPMDPGSVIRVETPSGAGYGNPLEREPERVLADVVSGKVSREGARREYGVVIVGKAVDMAATERERTSLKSERHHNG